MRAARAASAELRDALLRDLRAVRLAFQRSTTHWLEVQERVDRGLFLSKRGLELADGLLEAFAL